MNQGLPGSSVHGSLHGESKHTGVGCHFLLQGIFPTEGSNLLLLHWEGYSLPLGQLRSLPSPGGLAKMQAWVHPPQSFWLLRPRIKPISCISGKFPGRFGCCRLGTMVWEPLSWIKQILSKTVMWPDFRVSLSVILWSLGLCRRH